MNFSTIEECISKNLYNFNVSFVFPTDVASKKWADWTIKNTECQAVAMERFIAWDNFKGECIKSKQKDLETIPSLLRKIFAAKLLKDNEIEHFLSFLIPAEYAANTSAFTDSIAKLLPSLQMWKLLRDGQNNQKLELQFDDSAEDKALKAFYEDYKARSFTDNEDQDYEEIYKRYSAFLAEKQLFDPAWIIPDFSGSTKEYIIIYPEILEDWEQYKYKLSKVSSISFVHVPENPDKYISNFYENSRLELKEAALYLRQKHDEGISWSEMAVNVPNLDNYGSYIDREFELYEIPHSMRYSKALNAYGAGALFTQLQECVSNDFSFDSVKNLLLNEDIPWKQKFTIDNLLLFGKNNNCLCSWEDAFAHPVIDSAGLYQDQNLRNYFKGLKLAASNLVNAPDFKELIKAYNVFKEAFIDLESFAQMELSDKILSRCVSVMNELIDLEEKFGVFELSSPFSFFASHLGSVQYLTQGTSSAVQIYPYRTAAAAPYSIHLVIDATQDSLSVSSLFKPMSFMNENKKKLFIKIGAINQDLAFNDADPSYDFIKLYQHSSRTETLFTGAVHAFNGAYGFAHGKLLETVTVESDKKEENGLLKYDLYSAEKKKMLNGTAQSEASRSVSRERIYKTQKNGFENWKKLINMSDFSDSKAENSLDLEQLRRLIRGKLQVNHHIAEKTPELKDKLQISTTALKTFYQCPRLWLYKNILKIQPLDNESELIDTFIEGTVNHKIFELYFSELKNQNLPLSTDPDTPDQLSAQRKKLLKHVMNLAVEAATDTALKENPSAFYSFGKRSCSAATIRVIQSKYAQNENSDEAAPQFYLLESSIAALCNKWQGWKVYEMEKEVYALPPDPESSYVFGGRIDCILSAPNESEFTIVDFKTGTMPNKLYPEPVEKGKAETIIDFQMPMYIYLLENNVNEKERIKITNAQFYSIKDQKENRFCGIRGVNVEDDKKLEEDNQKSALAKKEFLLKAAEYIEKLQTLDFSVTLKNQNPTKCTSKGEFAECVDYQALCRRFFTVNGEQL